jgi:hypothetical protein
MTGFSVGLIAVVFSAIAGVFFRRWYRTEQRQRIPLVAGGLLIVLSILAGAWLLPTKQQPTGEPPGIGVVPPAPSRYADGFAVGMAITVHKCGEPVSVTVVANGTGDYWRDHPPPEFPFLTHFQIALPGHVRTAIGMTQEAGAIEEPADAVADPPSATRFFQAGAQTYPTEDITVVSGTVKRWARHLNAIVATFKADWLKPRGLGTCYLQMPSLTGGRSVLAAQKARGKATRGTPPAGELLTVSKETGWSAPYDPTVETVLGSTTVVVNNGDVLNEASRPGPDETTHGYATWVCETTPPTVHVINRLKDGALPSIVSGLNTGGGAYSKAYIKDTRGTDCDGIAVIVEASAGTKRDLLLLVLGALFSLGAAVLVDTLLGPTRAPRPRIPNTRPQIRRIRRSK